jgi:mono/diheme cytochrome c family protein
MLFLLNRLPFFCHPMLKSDSMRLITRDKFALAVERSGETLDVDAVVSVLKNSGAKSVEVIEDTATNGPVSANFLLIVLLAIGISSATAGYLTYWAMKLFPAIVPMVHMLDQPRLDPQQVDHFFKDGFGMRMPVPEAVMRGSVPYRIQNQEIANGLVNTLPRTERVLKQGKQAYKNYCSVCHGILGNGAPTLTAAYGAKPTNLVSRSTIDLSDGMIYHVIMTGKNAMPAYSADLAESERWAAVHYVRVLQRALNAKNEDIK